MWFSFRMQRYTGKQAPQARPPHRPAPFRPRLEALEDRLVPAQLSLTVTSLADAGPGTLRAAISAADAGRPSDKFTIDFTVTGTIDLQTPLPALNNSISIQGPGSASLTVERAAGVSFASAIVTLDGGQSASLSGLMIANGNAGGITNHGTMTVSGCTLSANSTASFGGGIFNGFDGLLTISGSTFSGNTAPNGGGAIYNGGTAMVSNSTLSGNSGFFGGGMFNVTTLTVTGCIISDNTALNFFGYPSGDGGGIWNDGALTVSTSTLTGNSAAHDGGSIWNVGTLTVSGGTLDDNSASDQGGAVTNFATLTVSASTISGNTAAGAGGILNIGSATIQQGSTLSHNVAGDAGAIYNAGALTVSNSTLDDNTATGFNFGGFHAPGAGGGIDNRASLTVRDSVFSGNSADLGGAIYNSDSNPFSLDVRGSTFAGNSASDSGGALYNKSGTATIQQSTLSGNTAGSDGGGIFNGASGTLAIKDSTVTGNSAAVGGDLYNAGVVFVGDSVVGDRYDV
jgi:predicted outer membrane repeat protein